MKKENHFHTLYDLDLPVYEKIEKIAKEVYGADGVDYTKAAKRPLTALLHWGQTNSRCVWQKPSTVCLTTPQS